MKPDKNYEPGKYRNLGIAGALKLIYHLAKCGWLGGSCVLISGGMENTELLVVTRNLPIPGTAAMGSALCGLFSLVEASQRRTIHEKQTSVSVGM